MAYRAGVAVLPRELWAAWSDVLASVAYRDQGGIALAALARQVIADDELAGDLTADQAAALRAHLDARVAAGFPL